MCEWYLTIGCIVGVVSFIMSGIKANEENFFDSSEFLMATGMLVISVPLWPCVLIVWFLTRTVNILNTILNKQRTKKSTSEQMKKRDTLDLPVLDHRDIEDSEAIAIYHKMIERDLRDLRDLEVSKGSQE